ncbi:hypothetical protein B5M09_010387 [Aphanomyces astaci]|uniref:Uncharacterized protein n=1 Tax=Aphanomyces astaci TaxID=112090 RepID=A0A3R7Y427_APHAT|nr:hypothetical protein B5M09_010387 [Aphanomyces astaci]
MVILGGPRTLLRVLPLPRRHSSLTESTPIIMSKSFQEASHDYLLARQRMNEKVNVCKDIEVKMTEILHQIQDAYTARGDQAKTVGSLSLTLVAAEGEVPTGTVIKVYVEPESIPDFEEIDESSEDKKNQVAWADKDAFPATFAFEAIQQREAVAYVTVGEDSDDATPLKEFTIPIASLFRGDVDAWFNVATGEADQVPKVVEEAVVVAESVETPSSTTPSTTETIFGIPPATDASTTDDAADKEEEAAAADTFHDAVQPPQVEDKQDESAPDAATAAAVETEVETKTDDESSNVVQEVAQAATESEQVAREAKVSDEVVQEAEVEAKSEVQASAEVAVETTVETEATVEGVEDVKEEADVKAAEAADDAEDKAEVDAAEDGTTVPVVEGRVRIQASFELSEIEYLAQQAVALSKAKADMDVEIRLCDQELTSARIRYERLKASQKPTTASSAAGGLLGGLKTKSVRAPAKPQVQLIYTLVVMMGK